MMLDFEKAPYVLQTRADGAWLTVSEVIRGRSVAQEALARARRRGGEFRFVGKNEADKYREGFKAAVRLLFVPCAGGESSPAL
jgi:hypothetical protein